MVVAGPNASSAHFIYQIIESCSRVLEFVGSADEGHVMNGASGDF